MQRTERAALLAAWCLARACRPARGRDAAAAAPDAPPPPAATTDQPADDDASALPRLDLSGDYANVVDLAPTTATRTASSTFYFAPEQAGTLVLYGVRYDYGDCARGDVDTRLFLHYVDDAGRTVELHEVEPMMPVRLTTPRRAMLVATARATRACNGGKATFALRYFVNAKDPASGGGGGGANTGGGPDPADHTPGGDPGSGGGPISPLPTPAPCAMPHGTPPSDAPASARGAIVLYATDSTRDGCRETLRLSVYESLEPIAAESCKLPSVDVKADNAAAGSMLKLLESHGDWSANVFWLSLGQDAALATRARDKLASGGTLTLAPAGDACATALPGGAGVPDVTLANDLDLLLFRGEPRDVCPTQSTQALDLAATNGLTASYRYSAPTEADFRWSAHLVVTDAAARARLAGGARFRLLNRHTRAFVTDWLPVASDADGLVLTVTDAASLRRLLPNQSNVEIVLASSPGDPRSCAAYAVPYYRTFQDSSASPAAFRDETNPGRSRFLLVEGDLPTTP
jgi:hypothetical protein